MKWRRRRREDRPRVDEARAALEQTRAQRQDVEEVARRIRVGVGENNFRANTFKMLAPGRKS